MLLGLKGSISELEQHTIRSRLTAGLLAKAERRELTVMLPIGLMRDPSGVVVKDPDMAVQGRLGLVFQLFLQLRSVAKVMRALNERDLGLPRRDRYGDLCWTRATLAAVAAILKNPAYAGAFVYGQTRFQPPKREGALPQEAPRPMEEWRIVVKDRYPAYIDWPICEKTRTVIRDNRAEYMRIKTRGAPRNGELLFHGIAWCARCGHKMYVPLQGRWRVRMQSPADPGRSANLPTHSRCPYRCSRWRGIPNRTRCLVPAFDGASLSHDSKEALWDKFSTAAPPRR
ncbi:recombinase family protein, partial [Bradyrhizobium sp. 153]|uniref:recombinase family protein n=1 Tax=Bradyrhizobium sp. 153 TaxID=2782627 RepID=UPI001FFA3209